MNLGFIIVSILLFFLCLYEDFKYLFKQKSKKILKDKDFSGLHMNLKGIYRNKSESTKLFLFVMIVFISALIGILSIGIISADAGDTENISQLKIIQLISSVFIFIIPPLLFSYFENNQYLKELGFNLKFKRQNILMILMIILFSQPLVAYCMQLNLDFIHSISDYIPKLVEGMKQMEDAAEEATKAFLKMDNIGDLLFNLFLIAIIPAIGEEMFFRGIIQKKLKNILRNPHVAILITSFIFSAIHMQFFGFLPRFFLGVILGYLFYYSGNLWMPIIAHFINNALAVFLAYFYSEKINEDISQLESSEISMIQATIFLLIVLFFFYLYKQINNKEIEL